MANKWFEGIFLPSLEEGIKAGACERWITEKQVDVCLKYMKEDRYFGNYFIKTKGKKYTVHVFKKGYGQFTVYEGY